MSEQKEKELKKQWVITFGSVPYPTNTDSEEVDSLKQETKNIKSENQTLRTENQSLKALNEFFRAQNELLRAHASSDTLLLLQQNNTRRDSFSHRVCDDLSEVILQFLPIKDKFRFECVSKQFQRTVYQRHYELVFNEFVNENEKMYLGYFKKLPNIKSVKFERFGRRCEPIIDLIIKNYKHLTEFKCSLYEISEKCKQLFAKTFGPQLTSLIIACWSWNFDSIMSSFVNIRDIDLIHYYEITDDFYAKIKVKNLKKVSTFRLRAPYNNNNNFETFIDNNKSITHLNIRYFSGNAFPIERDIKIISKLSQLISLRLHCVNELNSITNGLKYLSLNCCKLKSLFLEFSEIREDFDFDFDFMSEIKKFKELKRFGFKFNYIYGNSNEFNEYFINSLKTGFQNLTHLSIDFYRFELNEPFIENIVNYLPKLQNLFIENKCKVTERTADIVSRLSKLEHLELNILDTSLIDSFKNIIIKNCRKIKSIKINGNQY